MASTNRTTYYELPQYIGTDKPTYLADFNQAMATIDLGIHNALESGENANNSIGLLANLETTIKTDLVSAINEVDSNSKNNSNNIGDISNLSTIADNLVGAVNEVLSKVVPVGTIIAYAGTVAPAGWLMCNGAVVSRQTYGNLFSAIGTTYGDGDGSSTFAIPNLNGRVIVGIDSNDTSFNALGETGGEKEHVLTINEMPSHTHQNRATQSAFQSGGTTVTYLNSPSQPNYNGNGNTGGDQAHNNLQPYMALHYIIKY